MELKNWELLEEKARYIGIDIDPEKPRDSRLAVALEYDKHGKIPEAIEAMTGVPLHETDPMQLMVLSMRRQESTPESFYRGFGPADS